MAEHILTTCAVRRPYRTFPAMPDHVRYDPGRGYWLKDGEPLVATSEFLSDISSSKKCDQETGEDQKGE